MTEQEKKENEEKKEYLNSYIPLVKAAKRIAEEMERVRMDKMFPGMSSDGMPHGTNISDLSDYIVRVERLQTQLSHARYKRIEQYSKIFRDIELLDDERERQVLTYRYLRGYAWEKICMKMGYSWKQVHRIHGQALRDFKIGKNDIE